MINIYRADQEIGVALFDESGKFQYAERCDAERMVNLVNSFPSTQFRLFVDSEHQHLIDETFTFLPHIEVLTKVKRVKDLDVMDSLKELNRPPKAKRNLILVWCAIGVVLGTILLLPKSNEYKNSVLEQAKVMQEYTESQPIASENTSNLVGLIDALYDKYKVDAVYYGVSTYKVVLTTEREDLTLADFPEFSNASLTLELSLEDKDKGKIYVYRLEGKL